MREISNCIVRVIGLEHTDSSGLGIKPLVDTAVRGRDLTGAQGRKRKAAKRFAVTVGT